MTNQTNTGTASPKEAVKKVALATIIVGVLLGGVTLAINIHLEKSVEYQTQSMLSSLEDNGLTVDYDTAKKVSAACTPPRFSFSTTPLSTTIIQEHDGKKKTITIACDNSTKASKVDITPAS